MMNKEVYELSSQGVKVLEQELEKLRTVDRVKVREAIAEARGQGDLSENADYHSAREQQAIIETRILEIENQLKHVKIIEVVKVTVQYVDLGFTNTFDIVGTIEADPFSNKISNDSPLGKAVLDKKIGDVFYITSENGKEIKLKLIDMK